MGQKQTFMECPRLEQGGVDCCQPAVNRVNLTFSDLRLPDWRGANYPQSFYTARGTQILSRQSALPTKKRTLPTADAMSAKCHFRCFSMSVFGTNSRHSRSKVMEMWPLMSVSASLEDAERLPSKDLAKPNGIRPAVGRNVNVPNDSYYPPGILTTLISIAEK